MGTHRRIKKGYVETADGQVHYQTCAGSAAVPIALLHMTASAANSYDALMAELAGSYTTIACDTVNYGQSFRTDHEPSVPYAASVWLEALDRLGYERFDVLGHHTGASIAVEMAVQAPERVRSLILSGYVYTTPEENLLFAANFVQDNPITDYGTQLIGAWTRVVTTMDGEELPAEFLHRETVGTLVAGENWAWGYKAIFDWNPIEALNNVQCPIFLATGELDRHTIGFMPRIVADVPKAQVLVAQGRGVDYLDTHAAEFAPHLIKFVDGIGS
jgi:pimeloyl-ACP methyl ester carboxylesterase